MGFIDSKMIGQDVLQRFKYGPDDHYGVNNRSKVDLGYDRYKQLFKDAYEPGNPMSLRAWWKLWNEERQKIINNLEIRAGTIVALRAGKPDTLMQAYGIPDTPNADTPQTPVEDAW